MKRKTIAVSGGFDPIHKGHVRMILAAAHHGDVVVILNSDDYSHARAQTLVLGGTVDVDFSNNEILIAFVEPTAAFNSAMGAKVILEYTELET